MTLNTSIYISGTAVTQREIYDLVNDLLGIPAERRFTEGPADDRPWIAGDYEIRDGSLITPQHDDDCEHDCDYHGHTVPHHVVVNLDTAYGYRDERGWGCSQLHGWVIATLIGWLAPKGCSVTWTDEFQSTIHTGTEHLEAFLGTGDEAQAWFQRAVLPAVLASSVEGRQG